MIDTNSIGAQCPLVTLETIHTLFITATLFILSNNVYPNTFALSKSDARGTLPNVSAQIKLETNRQPLRPLGRQ